MAAGEDGACLSPSVACLSDPRPCNRSTVRLAPYSPQATAAFAIAITSMMLLTIVGNVLVIIAVLTSRSLRGAKNLFLVSLAAADILVATLIMPFSLANELQGYWAFSSVWCEIYLALDVLFCTSSIVHLCAIALDRYLCISRPVSYGAKRTRARIKAAIVVVWLISAVISFPPLLTLDKGCEEECELNDERWYILYSTVGSFFAPCVIMILVYVKIYQIAKQHTRCPPGLKGTAGGGNAAATAGERSQRSQHDQAGGAGGGDTPILHRGGGSGQREEAPPPVQRSTRSDSQILSAVPHRRYHDDGGDAMPDDGSACGSDAEDDGGVRKRTKDEGVGGPVPGLTCKYRNTVATAGGTKLVAEDTAKQPGTPISRRKAMINREKRFTFVLAVVMGVFVVCWFPFFLSYSLKAVCPQACSIPGPLFKFFFWIGYCNSCLNPVIYTVFNNDFRKAFKRILCRDSKGTSF